MFLHSEKFAPAAQKKLIQISAQLKINPDWLTAVIAKETAGTFSPSVKNPKSSATGLIQFMESTAKSLGTSTAALSRMSQFQQLDYVYAYLRPYIGRMISVDDVYFAVFYPRAIGKPDTYVLPLTASQYAVNKGIDLNKDGKITRGEFIQWFRGTKKPAPKKAPAVKKNFKPIITIIIIGAGLYFAGKLF